MLNLSPNQMTSLDSQAYERYLDQLCADMRQPYFLPGISKHLKDPASPTEMRVLARRLVEHAASYGFDCEGDVTPFCLLAICDAPELTGAGVFPWVKSLLTETAWPAEGRMDAVFSLLPETPRDQIFRAQRQES